MEEFAVGNGAGPAKHGQKASHSPPTTPLPISSHPQSMAYDLLSLKCLRSCRLHVSIGQNSLLDLSLHIIM
eukprot:4310804-Amphidinium_carterae.2